MTGTPSSTNVSTLMFEPNGPIAIFSAISSIRTDFHSDAITQRPQLLPYHGIQLRSLRHLLGQLRRQPLHLVVEGLVVVLFRLRADIAARRQHEAVLLHVRQ